ncbi:hypothetical protein FF1_032760 [Malus domestica]
MLIGIYSLRKNKKADKRRMRYLWHWCRPAKRADNFAWFQKPRWCLESMTALVTGGTKGIGYAIIQELAGLGATVHTCARNEAQIVERLQEWEDKRFKVTGSVNNAATTTLRGATDYTLKDFSSLMSTNASGDASVVFVSSIGGMIALPKTSAYAATKEQ